MGSQKAVIISAPSGSGKTTLVSYLLSSIPDLKFSISATSRKPRHNEQDGKDYYFMTPEAFRQGIRENRFIEWEEVYEGIYYGTLKSEIEKIWSDGYDVIFDVDVKGGINLKKYFGDSGLSVFITVSDIVELERRLKSRKTESKEMLQKRVSKAQYEMSFKDQFDVVIMNDDLRKAQSEAHNLITDFLHSAEK